MTIGEKIKEARKSAGLTQEQIAEKLMVSRQAITKWESDKGIPDVENLKAISTLLNVSIDYLLDNGQDMDTFVIREPIDLSKGKKNIKTNIVLEKYPDAEIWSLIAKQKLTRSEKVIDNVLGFVFNGPFGMPDLANEMKNMDKSFYLVHTEKSQYFVTVTNEYMESRKISIPILARTFEIGNMKFTKCRYKVNHKIKE